MSTAPGHGNTEGPATWSIPAPIAAPPAIPMLAVELIHAPASSGGTARARTAHA